MARVYLENGKTWTFACSLDFPGWCRRGKGEDAAIEELLDYVPRFRKVAGTRWKPGEIEVIGRVKGDATTDFGAPHIIGKWDHEPVSATDRRAQLRLLQKSWDYLDGVVASAPASLRKGPRGGGRDRDKVVDHVREAERAYAPGYGIRVPPRTPMAEHRDIIMTGLRREAEGTKWPWPYVVRRMAWHVLDHAWEIEDRSES